MRNPRLTPAASGVQELDPPFWWQLHWGGRRDYFYTHAKKKHGRCSSEGLWYFNTKPRRPETQSAMMGWLSLLLWCAGQYSRPTQQQSEDVFALATPLYHQIFYLPHKLFLSQQQQNNNTGTVKIQSPPHLPVSLLWETSPLGISRLSISKVKARSTQDFHS